MPVKPNTLLVFVGRLVEDKFVSGTDVDKNTVEVSLLVGTQDMAIFIPLRSEV
jgi:hypothetical protein